MGASAKRKHIECCSNISTLLLTYLHPHVPSIAFESLHHFFSDYFKKMFGVWLAQAFQLSLTKSPR